MDAAKLREAIAYYKRARANSGLPEAMSTILDAAEAHLATLPRTKEVDVWHVEFAEWDGDKWVGLVDVLHSREAAEKRAARHNKDSCFECIRITGPHRQEVPA